jgi:hypothetical protein
MVMTKVRETYRSTDNYDPVLRSHTRVGPPPYEAMDYGRLRVKVGRRIMTYREYQKTYLEEGKGQVNGAK